MNATSGNGLRVLAIVALLVKNAEDYLPEMLRAISNQKLNNEFELLVIDSGSTDSTLAILKKHPIKLIQIVPQEFGHGKTRNLAAEKAHPDSRFIVFLSQDALPNDDQWLSKLLAPFDEDPRVAGTFSRHIPRPGASPSLVRQLTINWQSGGDARIIKEMPQDTEAYRSNFLYYAYFSNTSSAIRRSVWEEFQFSEIDFAEDAEWADRVLKAGHRLIYEPSSTIIHSHDYTFIEQFRQSVDHTNAMIEIFDPEIYHDQWIWFKLLLNIPREVWRDWRFLYLSEFYKGAAVL